MLCGQTVAFADSIVKLPDGTATDGKVTDAGENYTNINGAVTDVTFGDFEFNEIESHFWELDVETENGPVTVLIAENGIDYTPECGDIISAHALISMDVAIERKKYKDSPYYINPYDGIIPDADDVTYRNGFLPNFHWNQKVLLNSISNGDFSRMLRCCAEEIEFADEKGVCNFIQIFHPVGVFFDVINDLIHKFVRIARGLGLTARHIPRPLQKIRHARKTSAEVSAGKINTRLMKDVFDTGKRYVFVGDINRTFGQVQQIRHHVGGKYAFKPLSRKVH
jgi:hypothetical protein